MTEIHRARTGCGYCTDCKYHKVEGVNHQCHNPDKPESWRTFINSTFAKSYHDCCVMKNDSDFTDGVDFAISMGYHA